jgi:hypothetical protein
MQAWVPILTRYYGRVVYIDGFAGPGIYVGGEEGSPIIAGLSKMKEAMWKVDERSGLQFSDATNPDQEVLFSPEPDFADLKRRLVSKFAGQEVSVSEVEKFVLAETPYRETHYKKQVLKAMERAKPPELQVTVAKKGRRAGSFPGGTRVRFSSP